MANSKLSELLEEFKQSTDDELLKSLLEFYDSSPQASQEQKVAVIANKLAKILKERINETRAS